jgi:DNA-binding response OmpR family regulator
MALRTANTFSFQPRMVLAHANPVFASMAGRYFRRQGWDVTSVLRGLEARRLARQLQPAVVVLGIDLPDESGWLVCDKIVRDDPEQQVVLVAPELTATSQDFAEFVGAAVLVDENDGVLALAEQVRGAVALPAAC